MNTLNRTEKIFLIIALMTLLLTAFVDPGWFEGDTMGDPYPPPETTLRPYPEPSFEPLSTATATRSVPRPKPKSTDPPPPTNAPTDKPPTEYYRPTSAPTEAF